MKNLFGWVLFIGLAIMLFMLLNKGSSQYASIPLDEFVTRLKSDRVQTVTIENDRLLGQFRQPEVTGNQGERVQRFQVQLPTGTTQNWTFTQWLVDNRQSAEVRVENGANPLQVIIPLIPWLLIFGFLLFFVFRKMRGAQATEMKPWPVYIVPAPHEQAAPQQPIPVTPTTPAPGGGN